jgi:A/G-specific adenine glycosylase
VLAEARSIPLTSGVVHLSALSEALKHAPDTRNPNDGQPQAGVLVPLFENDGELRCLLTQRTREVPHHKGQIAFPGGRLERHDADLLACALRETQEEVGLDPRGTHILGQLDDLVTSSGFLVRPFVALCSRPKSYAVHRREVARLIEAPLAHLLDPVNLSVRTVWDGTHLRPIYSIRYRRQEIWGASAAILVNLMRVLGKSLPALADAAGERPPTAAEGPAPYGAPATERPLTLRAPKLGAGLCGWYRDHARDLPWRRTDDPYAVWVSEIMLQQTRVETVIPYYERFLARFPTVEALGRASQEAVLKLWQGLGYYSRGRNLHAAARQIVAAGRGLPTTVDGWAALPGIGRSTAGAITAITQGIAAPILDGNVRRVLTRLLALREPPGAPVVERILWHTAETLTPSDDAATYSQAIMELGATCCTPRQPDCAACPWNAECGAHALGMTDALPPKRTRRPVPHHEEVAVVLHHGSQVLLARRPQRGLLAGLWGFPRDRVGPGEDPLTAARRLADESVGVHDLRLAPLASLNHAYSHFRITLHAYAGSLGASPPPPVDGRCWVPAGRLADYPMSNTDAAIVNALG